MRSISSRNEGYLMWTRDGGAAAVGGYTSIRHTAWDVKGIRDGAIKTVSLAFVFTRKGANRISSWSQTTRLGISSTTSQRKAMPSP